MGKVGIIVGIDPGTTAAWAILDLSGKVLQVGSSKEVGLANVIRIVHSLGKVYAIGTDKRVVPGMVASAKAKLGGEVISPKADLTKEYKSELAKGIVCENDHELDAFASACFAYRQMQPLLEKVRRAASEEDVPYDDLAMAVLDSGLGIKASLDLLDDVRRRRQGLVSLRSEPLNVMIAKESAQMRSIKKERDELRRSMSIHKQENAAFQLRIAALESRGRGTRRSGPGFDNGNHALELANKRSQSLAALARNLRSRSESLERALLDPSGFVVCKRMINLGAKEVGRLEHSVGIRLGDVLFVLRPREGTDDCLRRLREVGVVVVTSDHVDKGWRDKAGLAMVCVDPSAARHFESVVLIERSRFDAAKKEISLIEDVIGSYRQERKAIQK